MTLSPGLFDASMSNTSSDTEVRLPIAHKPSSGTGGERAVPVMPLLHLRHLWARRAALPYPFGEPGVTTWYNGRAAIWQGLKALGIGPGARVIAPAYTCGSELDVLVQAGLRLDYFRIGEGLAADLEDLRRLCEVPAAAIFVTHYYGFPQPMREIAALARERGMLLIEDASHALYSATQDGLPLGSFGDMAVFSLWKSVAIPDGGVLRLNPARIVVPVPSRGEKPGLAAVAGRLRHMFEETVATVHPMAVRALRKRVTDPLIAWLRSRLASPTPADRAPLGGAAGMPPEAAQIAFRPERRAWRMTDLSRYLLTRLAGDAIRAQRRSNYQRLHENLLPGAAAKPLLSHVPPHCCPLFYPLVAREPRAFCRFLSSRNVGFFRGWCVFHPHVEWGRFRFESELKEHVVVIPVHQGLSAADILQIAAAVNDWNADAARLVA